MTNIIEFKQSHATLQSNVADAVSIVNAINPPTLDMGLSAIADIDFGIKSTRDLNHEELSAAETVATALYRAHQAEAEAAGEAPAIIASVVDAVFESDNPKTIRDLTRGPQRRLSDVSFSELSSRERRLIVAAWALRSKELRDEIERRTQSGAAR